MDTMVTTREVPWMKLGKIEDKLGVLLPCNVIVRETTDGRIEVASVDPVVAMERTGNPALATTAEGVRRRLSKVISAVA